jgi:hypothetical protein
VDGMNKLLTPKQAVERFSKIIEKHAKKLSDIDKKKYYESLTWFFMTR